MLFHFIQMWKHICSIWVWIALYTEILLFPLKFPSAPFQNVLKNRLIESPAMIILCLHFFKVCLLSLTHHAGSAGDPGWEGAECRQDGVCLSLRHYSQPSKWGRDQRAAGAYASDRPHSAAFEREEEWWVDSTQIMLLSVSLAFCLLSFFLQSTYDYVFKTDYCVLYYIVFTVLQMIVKFTSGEMHVLIYCVVITFFCSSVEVATLLRMNYSDRVLPPGLGHVQSHSSWPLATTPFSFTLLP